MKKEVLWGVLALAIVGAGIYLGVSNRPRTQEPTHQTSNSGNQQKTDALDRVPGVQWYEVGDVIEMSEIDVEQIDAYFVAQPILEGGNVYQRIYGKSFPTGGQVKLEDLRYLKMIYYDYDGNIRCGEMIVNQEIAQHTLQVFRELFLREYPIARMELIENYWDEDPVVTDRNSIRANNTSAFFYRNIAGTDQLSNHAYGYAIDINPYDNPYFYLDEAGEPLLEDMEPHEQEAAVDRSVLHAITHEDLAYQLFTGHGFAWGGDWSNPLDYQHFEWDGSSR